MMKVHSGTPGLLVALLALASVPAFALDLNLDLGLADRAWYRYDNETGPRQTTALSLGQAIGDIVYLSADFWNSNALGVGPTQWVVPREQDYTLTVDLYLDPVSVGVFGTLYATAATRGDLGLYFKTAIPLMDDILSLDAGLRAVTDFTGFYGEMRLGPSVLVPLDLPLGVAIQVRAGLMAGGYGGHAYAGFTNLSLQPKATLYFDKYFRLSALGGYSFDLSGGVFSSYPFVGIEFGISASTAEPEQP